MKKDRSFLFLIRRVLFYLIPTSGMRTKYIYNHKSEFKHIGVNLFWQPRIYPSNPELISLGNNCVIAARVQFINHDVIDYMLNTKFGGGVCSL